MGFLSSLFQKKDSKSPLEQLRERADANPDDPRVNADLASQLKAAGDLSGALEYAMRGAKAHQKAGFAQRALAVLKTAHAWGQPTPELLEEMIAITLELKLKEDARGMLMQLRGLKQGDRDALAGIDAKIAELGPGR